MSLSDDLWRINQRVFVPIAGSNTFVCFYCRLESQDAAHTDDCPVPRLPRVRAVLAKYEALVQSTVLMTSIWIEGADPNLKPSMIQVLRDLDAAQDCAEGIER